MKKILAAVVVLILLGSLGSLGYTYYNNHYISSDLRRTITAACDAHATVLDEVTYLHEARLETHTKADRLLLEKTETSIQLIVEASNQLNSPMPNPYDVDNFLHDYEVRIAADKLAYDKLAEGRKKLNEVRSSLGQPVIPSN